MTYFCRLNQKLASPWFHRQKDYMIFDFCQKALWHKHKLMLLTHFVKQDNLHGWKLPQWFLSKTLTLGYKQTTIQSQDFNVTTSSFLRHYTKHTLHSFYIFSLPVVKLVLVCNKIWPVDMDKWVDESACPACRRLISATTYVVSFSHMLASVWDTWMHYNSI